MAEIMEKAKVEESVEKVQQSPTPKPAGNGTKKKKRRKIIIIWCVVLLLVAAGIWAWNHFFGEKEPEVQVVTDLVQYGSITSMVEGSGLTKAKNSQTITLTTEGTVMEVMVSEGQKVNEGDPLFIIESEAARLAVEKAQQTMDGYEKQLSALYKDIEGLNLAPTYGGKLMDVVTLNPGDTITKGQKVATLADDTQLRLKQYYSYAYKGEVYPGQSVEVSLPALMTTVTGTVSEVHMVSRITPEGAELFSVEILVPNAGALTAEMTATATMTVNGEKVYPYEAGKLEYYRVGDLCSTVNGTVISSSLVDYLQVNAGQVLVRIDGESSENEIFELQQTIEEAQKTLDTAVQNLNNCNAVAPISGTVIGLTLQPGMEVNANSAVITIADTSTITVDATVDERNVSNVKPGMAVEIDQWGSTYYGVVESVSLNSNVEGGVARYPMVVTVDNMDGGLMTGSYINYSLVASQSDNCLVVPIQCVKSVPMEDGSTGDVLFVGGERPENAIELTVPVDGIPEGFWAVPVETGISDDYYVEIKSGVEEGTEVFTQLQTSDVWM